MSRFDKLLKAYTSDAQRKFFNSPAGKKEVGAATVKEFNEKSKGLDLPEHVKKASEHEKGVHGNVVSQDAAQNYGVSDAGRNARAQKQANDRGMYNHAVEMKETAKRFHGQILNQLKSMVKPNLPKSDLEKARPGVADTLGAPHPNTQQKGVNAPKQSYSSHAHNPAIANQGSSEAGHRNMVGDSQGAKNIHHRTLEKLKSMTRPNLPKSDMEKASANPAMPKPKMPQGGAPAAAQPAKPPMPKAAAPKPPVMKNDPTTHLPGTMLDKSAESAKLKAHMKSAMARNSWGLKKDY